MQNNTELNCSPRGAYTCVWLLFCCCDLDINPMTLKLESDLDILKMYFHTKNEVATLRHSKLLMMDEISGVLGGYTQAFLTEYTHFSDHK